MSDAMHLKAKTSMILGVIALGLAQGPATAKTIIVGPDDCARPANTMIIIAGGDVAAVDLNHGRRVADGVVVIYDARFEGWARRRLFARFAIDPIAGHDVDAVQPLCGGGDGFPAPAKPGTR